VRALREQGHEVSVYTAAKNRQPPDIEGQEILTLEGLTGQSAALLLREDAGLPHHLPVEIRRLLFAEYIQRELYQPLEAFNPHVIYERYSLFAYAGLELARKLRIAHLLEVNSPLAEEASRYRDLVLRSTATALEGTIWRGTDALLPVSSYLARYARGVGVHPEKITIVPTGVDPEVFHPGISGAHIRAKYGLADKTVVGFVGSLKPWHDIDTLLMALRRLTQSAPGCHLLVIGTGPRFDQLLALHEATTTFVGAVDHADVPSYLAAMDIIAVPYAMGDHYFSPIKLFEAMAMAKPVIGARIGQVADVIANGVNGLLYQPGNANELASAIGDIRARPEWAASMGLRARETIKERYTWRHVADKIAQVADSVLQGAAAR
jgi:glycosyltransferase involved in cell wall biosynthesis